MKKVILAGTILILTIGSILVWPVISRPTETISTEEQILKSIAREFPSFSADGKPVIELSSISTHDNGWYVATIKSLQSVKNPVPVRLVLLETDGQIRTILGPDVHFSEEEMLALNIPDSVILEILES